MADIKLKDLRYLVAVADTRHFGRAAERSFVSQPTLSAQLKKLEEYLGVQLIERAPKRVALTAAGEEIVERARRILEASEEIVELARGHRDPLAGRLKIALLPTIGPYLLPNVAAKLRKQLPRLETLRQMVASGVGITLLPELAGRGAYGNARGVSIRPFAKPVPTRTIGAVWRKSTARRAAILALAKSIEANAL